jgi:hypothetical protein
MEVVFKRTFLKDLERLPPEIRATVEHRHVAKKPFPTVGQTFLSDLFDSSWTGRNACPTVLTHPFSNLFTPSPPAGTSSAFFLVNLPGK